MDSSAELAGKDLVDCAMALDQAEPLEGAADHAYAKVVAVTVGLGDLGSGQGSFDPFRKLGGSRIVVHGQAVHLHQAESVAPRESVHVDTGLNDSDASLTNGAQASLSPLQ